MSATRDKPKGVRMINEIKRLHKQGLNKSQIAKVVGTSRNTVRKYLNTDEGTRELAAPFSAPWSNKIDWEDVKTKTNDGVKLSHYWEQYIDLDERITYISFWREFKRRFPSIPIDLRKVYEPGQRCEFDFKGRDSGFGYFDRVYEEFIPCRLFGNILC